MNSAGNRRRRSTSAHCGIRAMCALALCAPLAAIASSAPGPHSAAPVPAVEIEVATEAEPTGRNTAQRRRIPIPPPPMAHTERCGTIVRPDDWPLLLERQAAGLYSLPAKAIAGEFTVPVTNHVIRRSNGTGGLSAAALADQMAGANALWEPAGIQFCQWGPTRYIDSDFWFHAQIDGPMMDSLRTIDVVSNTINVYWVPNFNWCGYSSFTWSHSQGIVMMNSCALTTPNIFAHEIGHYFDLIHTFSTAGGVECTSGSNCETAGDLVCDTPADPFLGLGTWVTDDCEYIPSEEHEPPCPDDPPYDPLADNMMSYSSPGCLLELTPGQIERAVATLVNLRPELHVLGGCDGAAACGSGAGNCFTSNSTPGCDDASCCAKICGGDAFCCNVEWDGICANQAAEICADGNICETAVTITDSTSVSLIDFTPSGFSSPCSSAAATDRWFKYTATCTGEATARICTEFIADNVQISVFEGCGGGFGSEIACGNKNPGCFLEDLNARVTWSAMKNQTYLLRVAAVATVPNSVTGAMHVECDGCGMPGSGDCFNDQSGNPYCEGVDCCLYVCEADSFCCDFAWDDLCADQAAQHCTPQCGSPIMGSCFDENTTPNCDHAACCDSVCGFDPFCCDVRWDSFCASAASTAAPCNVVEADGLHFIPLGQAQLSPLLGGVTITNIGVSGEDGVRLNLDATMETGAGSFEVELSPSASGPEHVLNLAVHTSGTLSLPVPPPLLDPQATLSFVNTPQSLNEILIALNVGDETYGVQVFDGNTLVFEQSGAFGDVVARLDEAVTPSDVQISEVDKLDIELSAGFPQTVTLQMGPQGFPVVSGDRIIISSEQAQTPGGVASPIGTISRVELTGAGLDDFDLHDVTVVAPTGCAGHCGQQAQIGCWCDAACFFAGNCCSDVCDHCADGLQGDDCAGPCPADITGPDGKPDGEVDVFDLLAVIGEWGKCPDPDNCPADITGPAGTPDGDVDVFDLLEVIGSWGSCP